MDWSLLAVVVVIALTGLALALLLFGAAPRGPRGNAPAHRATPDEVDVAGGAVEGIQEQRGWESRA